MTASARITGLFPAASADDVGDTGTQPPTSRIPWFRIHAARMYPVTSWLTGNAPDTDGLVQETSAKAFAAAERFQLSSTMNAWLHRIMIRTS